MLDVGANIGLFSLFLMLGDEGCIPPRPGRVWAFEPVPPIRAVLHSNLERYGLLDLVRLVQRLGVGWLAPSGDYRGGATCRHLGWQCCRGCTAARIVPGKRADQPGSIPNCLPARCPPRQVHIVPAALHFRPGLLRLTYYPKMPGNSTAKPEEKWLHQRRAMTEEAAVHAFCSAEPFDCAATTLAAFVEQQGLERIDLLKVQIPFVFGVILGVHAKNFHRA